MLLPLKYHDQTMVLGYQRVHLIERTFLKMWAVARRVIF